MEVEFGDDRRRSRWVIVFGVLLAVVAGIGAYYVISQAQQQAGLVGALKVPAVVAVRAIPARQAITEADVQVRQISLDPSTANGVITDPAEVIDRVSAVSVLQGQVMTTNMLASSLAGGQFSILGPDESVGPDSEAWRAVSLTVSDDLAVGGMLEVGQSVDVFVTLVVNVPGALIDSGRYYTDRSTKITYQDMVILARDEAFYVVRASLQVAEEIAHLQATGNATFSFALRPDVDDRAVDMSGLGETTNQIIERYGLPIPVPYPPGSGPLRLPQPTPTPTPSLSPTPSPSPIASPSAVPS
jgi:Flp pilus assembly protein CpaB